MNRIFRAAWILLSLVTGACFAESYPALTPMPKEYLTAPGDVIEVTNMPEARSQGALPICYGISAWYLYVQAQCKADHLDCKNLDETKVPSILAVSALGIGGQYNQFKTNRIVPYKASGDSTIALNGMAGEEYLLSDSCYSPERLLQKYHGKVTELAQAFESLKANYFDKRAFSCKSCLIDAMHHDFDADIDETTAAKALSENYFDEFLYDVFLSRCTKKVHIADFHLRGWPGLNDVPSYEGFISALVRQLHADVPVAVGLCLNQKAGAKGCDSGHDLAIIGYRKICLTNNTECRDFIKVQSSWGTIWQKLHSDGWVDAKTFYEHFKGMSWIDKWRRE